MASWSSMTNPKDWSSEKTPEMNDLSREPCDVLLVNPPWGSPESPSIQLSILKPVVIQAGFGCHVLYSNLYLSRLIGPTTYMKFQKLLTFGEWMFTKQAFGDYSSGEADYLDYLNSRYVEGVEEPSDFASERLVAKWLGADNRKDILNVREDLISTFLNIVRDILREHNPRVIGLTSTFNQNVPSLAIAKLAKQENPGVSVILGGANCEGEMGPALLRSFRHIDYVVSGEGEETLPNLLRIVLGDDRKRLGQVPGISFRESDEVRNNKASLPITDLGKYPHMDCSDYYQQLNKINSQPGEDVRRGPIYFECSRGCWWGQHSQCTFCGLNGEYINYRAKSPERVYEEILRLSRRHGVLDFAATDNILNPSYFASLIPRLRATGFDFRFFFEVKSTMTKAQVKLLSDTGVKFLQPGIESFSTHVLELMKKGTTMLQNVQALKWFEEARITPEWNFLFGFPGEVDRDYEEMELLLPHLYHLPPPVASGRIEMHRFSPNFELADSLGFDNLRPLGDYQYLYPTFDEEELRKVAYYFDYDLKEAERFLPHMKQLQKIIENWRIRYYSQPRMKFSFGRGPGFVEVIDQRNEDGLTVYKLRGLAMAIFIYCDRIRSLEEIESFMRSHLSGVSGSDISDSYANLCEKGILLHESENYLALPVALKPTWD